VDPNSPPPRVQWSPQFAPHVKGWYDERQYDPDDGMPDTQRWGAHCDVCQHDHQGSCDSGQVRKHIQRFALVHLHGDPLSAPRVVGEGSKRVGPASDD
jgi:hypothetical protein